MKVLFVWPNKDSFGFKPISISSLSAIAKNRGWETKLFDTTYIDFGFVDNTESGQSARIFKPVDMSHCNHVKQKVDLKIEFERVYNEFKPDLIAMSVLSDEIHIAGEVSKIAKELNPKIPIIWGGKYPTLEPEKTLNTYHIDFVCIAEGYGAFEDFLRVLEKGELSRDELFGIMNIWGKKNGEIIRNQIRPLEMDLDSLPYLDWDIYDERHFYKPFDGRVWISGDYMTNVGCPYLCTYCINHKYREFYDGRAVMRRQSVERTISELKYLSNKHNINFFKFHDEDFLMRPTEIFREFSEAYKKEVNIPFVIETNPKTVKEEKVKLLKNMNCASATLAIETGNAEIRKEMLKRVDTEEDIKRAFKLLKKYGVRNSAFNMLGLPFETRETYEETILVNRKADVQYPNIGFFFPFDGTDLKKISVDNGFFEDKTNTKVYKHDKPALTFDNLSESELIEMRNTFTLYVKLPDVYNKYIKRSEKLDTVGKELRSKLLEIFENTVFNNDGWYIDDGKENHYIKTLDDIVSLGALKESVK